MQAIISHDLYIFLPQFIIKSGLEWRVYGSFAGNSMIEVIITHGGKKWRRGARPGRWNIYGSIIMEIICSPL